MLNIPFVFILIVIVAGVVFLAKLGKHGWNPVLKVLLVLAVVPVALLFIARISYEHRPAPATLVMEGQNGEAIVTVEQQGEVAIRGPDGSFVMQPIHSQHLVPNHQRGVFDIQAAQARSPIVRGRLSILSLILFLGLAGLIVGFLVRRGSWSWPVVLKVGVIGVGVCVLLAVSLNLVRRERSRNNVRQEAVRISTSIEQPLLEAPRIRRFPASEVPQDARRYRDVEVWRRESVLGFVPFSPKERPDWCHEGVETAPESVRSHDTMFLSALRGRDWLVGYSSQNPQIAVAQREALAAARRKLALEALLQLKNVVTDFDVLPFEDLAVRLATRYSIGDRQYTYVEKATLEREQRPYGSVYRAAVRIAADPATVDVLARRIGEHVDRFGSDPQPELGAAFFSGMLLVVLAFSAFLVYVFIRAGTTGRWAYPLRVVAGGMLVANIAAVIYVSVNLGAT